MHFVLHPLTKLIAEGEGSTLDFKKTISSAKKIARTLVAFANSHGGRLLIGVKDNGTVAGVRSEEELYMIDSAANFFCEPPVTYTTQQHEYRGLVVLEVMVGEGQRKPHRAKGDDGLWHTYVRLKDKTLLASPLLEALLRRQASPLGTRLKFTSLEEELLALLRHHSRINMLQVCKELALSERRAQPLLVNLIATGVLNLVVTEREEYFLLAGVQHN